jgi:predicted nucleotidyltransferase
MNHLLASKLPHIATLCEKHGVAHLELFGSAASTDFNPDTSDFDLSDFDFLVELDPHISGSRAKR